MEAVKLFKCLSDGTRLNLTLLVQAEGEICVCDLMQALEESQPKVSRHLAQLRNCGILTDRRRGQWVFYALHPQLPKWALKVLTIAADSQQAELDAHRARLNAIKDRACC